jgi:hypothetical protein
MTILKTLVEHNFVLPPTKFMMMLSVLGLGVVSCTCGVECSVFRSQEQSIVTEEAATWMQNPYWLASPSWITIYKQLCKALIPFLMGTSSRLEEVSHLEEGLDSCYAS